MSALTSKPIIFHLGELVPGSSRYFPGEFKLATSRQKEVKYKKEHANIKHQYEGTVGVAIYTARMF